MSFALRYRERIYPLPIGEHALGRSDECAVCVEDPLASRRHALITLPSEGEPTIRDLSSRNGTFVNGRLIAESVPLVQGDRIRIGSQEIAICATNAAKLDTLTDLSSRSFDALGLLGQLAEKALAMGNAVEAERILARYLEEELERARSGRLLSAEKFEGIASFAYRLAEGTRRADWLDFLFTLHEVHGRIMNADMVHSLYDMSRHVHGSCRPQLVSYINSLRDPGASRTPSEKFVLGRLDGLTKLMV